MEDFFDWNGDRRVVFWIYLHNISHHVPPFLGYRVNTIGSVLGVAFALTLLIAKQDVCVLIPINGIVADAAVFYHLHQFWPDGSMAFLVFLFATRLEVHFKSESHIYASPNGFAVLGGTGALVFPFASRDIWPNSFS